MDGEALNDKLYDRLVFVWKYFSTTSVGWYRLLGQ